MNHTASAEPTAPAMVVLSPSGSCPTTRHIVQVNMGEYQDEPFEFVFNADGTGAARDIHFDVTVDFTWDPAIVENIDRDKIADVLSEQARDLFWDEINDQLGEDRILTEGDYGTEGVEFDIGSSEELEQAVRLVLYCFPLLWEKDRDEVDVTIRAGTECEEAHFDPYNSFMDDPDIVDNMKNAIGGLVSLALGWNDPYGWSLEYNDGAVSRASGHYESAEGIDYTIPRPSFHELAEARHALLKLFREHEVADEAEGLLPPENEE